MEDLYTIDQFAEKIKAQYPSYSEMDNRELTEKILAKYPVYKDQVDFEKKSPVEQVEPLESSVEEVSTDTIKEDGAGEESWLESFERKAKARAGNNLSYDVMNSTSAGSGYMQAFIDQAYNTAVNSIPATAKTSLNAFVNNDFSDLSKKIEKAKSEGKSEIEVDMFQSNYFRNFDPRMINPLADAPEEQKVRKRKEGSPTTSIIPLDEAESKVAELKKEVIKTVVEVEQANIESSKYQDPSKEYSDMFTPLGFMQNLGQFMPQVGVSVVAPFIGSYAQIYGDTYHSTLKEIAAKKNQIPLQDVTPNMMIDVIENGEDEQAVAAISSSAGASLDFIGIGKLAGVIKGPFSGLMRSSVKKGLQNGGKAGVAKALKKAGDILSTSSFEFVTEGSQSGIQQFGTGIALDKSIGEALNGINWEQVLEEGTAGAMGAGPFGAVNSSGIKFNSNDVEAMIAEDDIGAIRQYTQEGFIDWRTIPAKTRNKIKIEKRKVGKNSFLYPVEIIKDKTPEVEVDVNKDVDLMNIQKETIGESIDKPNVYTKDGKKGAITTEGKTVVLETRDEIIDLGNIDELADKDISEVGLTKESTEAISVDDDFSVTMNGQKYSNRYSDPNQSINYNENGEVISINLETDKGEKRTMRGQRAEEIAYQYKQKQFENEATDEQIERAAIEAGEIAETERQSTDADSEAEATSTIQPLKEQVDEQTTTTDPTGVSSVDEGKEPTAQPTNDETGSTTQEPSNKQGERDVIDDLSSPVIEEDDEQETTTEQRQKAQVDVIKNNGGTFIDENTEDIGILSNAIKSTKGITSKDGASTKFVVVDGQDGFDAIVDASELTDPEQIQTVKESNAFFDPQTQTVVYNKSKIKDTTEIHEVIHPVLESYLVNNEAQVNKMAADAIKNDISLLEFIEPYEGRERSLEAVVEGMARAAKADYDNKGSVRIKIKDFFDDLLSKAGLNRDVVIKGDESYVQLSRKLSDAFRRGRKIVVSDKAKTNNEVFDTNESSNDTGRTSDSVEIQDEVKPTGRKINLRKQLTKRNFDESKVKKGSIKDLKGKQAFVFAADRAIAGFTESPTGVKYEWMGGFFYTYMDGTGAWAFTDGKAANDVLNKVKETDGVGLVMIQAPAGIKGSFSFLDYVTKEYENAIQKGTSEKKIIAFINSKLDTKLGGVPFRKILNKKSGVKKFSSISDLKKYMKNEGKGKWSYEERGGFLEKILNAENEKRFGIPRLEYGKNVKSRPNPTMLDYVNDPAFKDLEYGDVVGAIQFDPNSKVIDTRKDDNYRTHPSYPFILEGKPLVMFEEAYDVRDIAPDFVPKSKEANQTPLAQRDKPQAARSAMGSQPIIRLQKSIPKTPSIAKVRDFILDNEQILSTDLVYNSLKVEGVDEITVNQYRGIVSRLIESTKKVNRQLLEEGNETKKDQRIALKRNMDAYTQEIATLNDFLSSIAKIDRLKKVFQNLDTVRKFYKKGKLGEHWEKVGFLTNPNYVNPELLSDKLFNAYSNLLNTLAKKLKRGTITYREIIAMDNFRFALHKENESLELENIAGLIAPSVEKTEVIAKMSDQELANFFDDITQKTNSGFAFQEHHIELFKGNKDEILRLIDEINQRDSTKDIEEIITIPLEDRQRLWEKTAEGVNEFEMSELLGISVDDYVEGFLEENLSDADLELLKEEPNNLIYVLKKGKYYNRRNNLIGQLKSQIKKTDTKVINNILSERERQYARTILSVKGDEDLLNFENYEIKHLINSVASIRYANWLPPIAATQNRKINGIRKAVKLTDEFLSNGIEPVFDERGKLIPSCETKLRDLIRKDQTVPFVRGELIKLLSENVGIAKLGRFKSKAFENFLNEFDAATESYSNRIKEVNKKRTNLFLEINRNTKIDVRAPFGTNSTIITEGENLTRQEVNVLIKMLQIEQQYLSNPLSKKVPKLSQLVKFVTKYDKAGEIGSEQFQDYTLNKLWKLYGNKDGTLNIAGVNALLKKAKAEKFVQFLRDEADGNQSIVLHNAKYRRGEGVEIYNNYTPLRTRADSKKASELQNSDRFASLTNPATIKSKTSIARTEWDSDSKYRANKIDWDAFGTSSFADADAKKDYYLSESYLDAYSTLSMLRGRLNASGDAAVEAVQQVIQAKTMAQLSNESFAQSFPIINKLMANTKRSLLSSATRPVQEVVGNVLTAYSSFPVLVDAVNGKTISPETATKLARMFNTSQADRLQDELYYGEAQDEVGGYVDGLNPNPSAFMELFQSSIGSKVTSVASKTIGFADKFVGLPMWRAKFFSEFKEITGTDWNDNILEDGNLTKLYEDGIQDAMNAADMIIKKPFMGSALYQTTVYTDKEGRAKTSWNNIIANPILGWFTGFRKGQTALLDEAWSVVSPFRASTGAMSKAEASRTVAGVYAGNLSYGILSTLLTDAVLDHLLDVLIGDDEEKYETEDKMAWALENGLMEILLLSTPVGKWSSVGYGMVRGILGQANRVRKQEGELGMRLVKDLENYFNRGGVYEDSLGGMSTLMKTFSDAILSIGKYAFSEGSKGRNNAIVNNAQALTRVGGIPFSKQAMDLIKRVAPEEKKEKKKKTKATRRNF